MARNVAEDCGNPDFVLIARTDGLSAVDAPESLRHMDLAIERGLRYLDTGIPDLLWCEFPTSDRGPVEKFSSEIHKRFPEAKFAFNWSSSFKWYKDDTPMTFAELGDMGVAFIFITLGAQHATGHGLSTLLQANNSTGTSSCRRRSGSTVRISQRAAITSSRECRITTLSGRLTTRRDSVRSSWRRCRKIKWFEYRVLSTETEYCEGHQQLCWWLLLFGVPAELGTRYTVLATRQTNPALASSDISAPALSQPSHHQLLNFVK
jgi:hypothetical protein